MSYADYYRPPGRGGGASTSTFLSINPATEMYAPRGPDSGFPTRQYPDSTLPSTPFGQTPSRQYMPPRAPTMAGDTGSLQQKPQMRMNMIPYSPGPAPMPISPPGIYGGPVTPQGYDPSVYRLAQRRKSRPVWPQLYY